MGLTSVFVDRLLEDERGMVGPSSGYQQLNREQNKEVNEIDVWKPSSVPLVLSWYFCPVLSAGPGKKSLAVHILRRLVSPQSLSPS